MKRILFSLLTFAIIISACSPEEEIVEITPNPDWTAENFKNDYTIQFPDTYEGSGMVGFEGNLFNKYRPDDKVKMSYSFCNGLFCDDFGAALANPNANTITVLDVNSNEVVLNSRIEFQSNGETIGIFYYDTETTSTGRYYMKQGDDYLEALWVLFDSTEYDEVESIIRTISEI